MTDAAAKAIRRALAALRRELQGGCADSVPGGVSPLVARLADDLGEADLPERARESLGRLTRDLAAYARLSSDRRQPLVERALRLL